ncbi:hypothetical protein NX774_20860 [Massilia agilis]|uniref:Uncharacterized protein n=1 Tax=Massilia agilis TaxID=1811226 RepID=A0ABT2DGJ6_9BURK|nr:hypothetical protein [Massilia agilis]MCS0810382.1 hypothetical protein [Massilia agilis]
MKKLMLLLCAGALVLAFAATAGVWSGKYKNLNASYLIYSGEPGERAAPTKSDRKIAIAVTGEPAREIFESLYPDEKDVTCTTERGERLRRKGDVWCSFRPSDGYKCFMGFNLRNGESHSGASC